MHGAEPRHRARAGAAGRAAPGARRAANWRCRRSRWRLGPRRRRLRVRQRTRRARVALDALRIDRAPVSWRRYLPFIEAGGYADDAGGAPTGRDWRARARRRRGTCAAPTGGWLRRRSAATSRSTRTSRRCNLSCHEAEAWCRWAGRRLPTEAEWERAALHAAGDGEVFEWGQVWEWTASAFAPYPGFVAAPVPRLLDAVVRRPPGAARRLVRHARRA